MSRTTIVRGARLALGAGLLLLLLSRVDSQEIAQLAEEGDPKLLALGIALLLLANPILQALRLHALVVRYTQRFGVTLKVFLVGAFFNLMLPSNVGGDAVKLVYLRRMNAENWAAPFALLMLHRVTGMVSLLLAAAVYALLESQRFLGLLQRAHVDARLPLDPRWIAAVFVAVGIGVAAWFALARGRRQALVAKLSTFARQCVSALAGVGLAAALALLSLTLLFHAIRMLGFCVLVAYAGEHLSYADSLIVLAATAVAGVIPITVGGLGLMEGAVSVTLLLYGVPEHAGLLVGLSNRLVLLVGAALGGVINLTFRAPGPTSDAPPEIR